MILLIFALRNDSAINLFKLTCHVWIYWNENHQFCGVQCDNLKILKFRYVLAKISKYEILKFSA